jgi:phage-related minor tail protein
MDKLTKMAYQAATDATVNAEVLREKLNIAQADFNRAKDELNRVHAEFNRAKDEVNRAQEDFDYADDVDTAASIKYAETMAGMSDRRKNECLNVLVKAEDVCALNDT